MYKTILYMLLFLPVLQLKAGGNKPINRGAKEDSLTQRQILGAMGPFPYELPPEKTKEQLLEEAYIEKHKEASVISQFFKDRDLLLSLNTLGYQRVFPGLGFAENQEDNASITNGLQKSIQEYLQIGNQQMVANLQNRLGICYVGSKQYDKAIACFLNALSIKRELKDFDGAIQVSRNLATLYKFRGNKEDADQYYRLMYKMASDYRDLNAQAYAMEQLALLKADKGYYLEAQLDLIKKILPLYKRAKNVSGRINAYNNLAFVYAMEKKYTESRWFYLQAIKVATKGGDARDLAYSLYYLAGIKRRLEEYQLAINDYRAAASYASKTRDKPLKMRIYDELGDIYIRTKDYDGASASLKEYKTIRASLNLDKLHGEWAFVQLGE